jgi:hypothetical protein
LCTSTSERLPSKSDGRVVAHAKEDRKPRRVWVMAVLIHVPAVSMMASSTMPKIATITAKNDAR